MAVIAHLGVLFPPFPPLLFLLTNNIKDEKSEYIEFHAEQAFLYQLFFVIAGIFLSVFIVPLKVTFDLPQILFLLLSIAFVLYGFYAAYKAFRGEEFRYVFVGNLVSKY